MFRSGIGAYCYIVFSILLRYALDDRQDEFSLVWPHVWWLPEVVRSKSRESNTNLSETRMVAEQSTAPRTESGSTLVVEPCYWDPSFGRNSQTNSVVIHWWYFATPEIRAHAWIDSSVANLTPNNKPKFRISTSFWVLIVYFWLYILPLSSPYFWTWSAPGEILCWEVWSMLAADQNQPHRICLYRVFNSSFLLTKWKSIQRSSIQSINKSLFLKKTNAQYKSW